MTIAKEHVKKIGCNIKNICESHMGEHNVSGRCELPLSACEEGVMEISRARRKAKLVKILQFDETLDRWMM